jgi:hypothetical protein
MWYSEGMNTTDSNTDRAAELERQANLLRSALLAPSMREDALRDEAAALRATA